MAFPSAHQLTVPASGYPHRLSFAFREPDNKANSLAQEGTDQPFIFTIVTNRASRSIDTAGKRRFRNDPPAPYGGKHLILADDPVAVAEQKFQKVEHLRLELNEVPPDAVRAWPRRDCNCQKCTSRQSPIA